MTPKKVRGANNGKGSNEVTCLASERREEVRTRDERNGGRANGTSCVDEKD